MSEKKSKTNHQTGYHKPTKNPTTNYPMDKHQFFCKRCYDKHEGICPASGRKAKSQKCSL